MNVNSQPYLHINGGPSRNGAQSVASFSSTVVNRVSDNNWFTKLGVQASRPGPNDLANPSSSQMSDSDPRKVEKELYLLNCCFEDVQMFILKLQAAVNAYKAKKEKLAKLSKKGNKSLSANPRALGIALPRHEEYVECFKLIKLSFILLARLNGVIQNPNAVDKVHILFQILYVAVNSSRNSKTKAPELARRIVNPVLTRDAIILLENSLDSNEKALWKELGEAWTASRETWRWGFVPTYIPKFSDGFTPSLIEFDSSIFVNSAPQTVPEMVNGVGGQDDMMFMSPNYQQGVTGPVRYEAPVFQSTIMPYSGHSLQPAARPAMMTPVVDTHSRTNLHDASHNFSNGLAPQSRSHAVHAPHHHHDEEDFLLQEEETNGATPWDDRQRDLVLEAYEAGHRVYQATENKIALSQKELSVQAGELVAVLDSSRNWWLVRNCMGEEGVVSHTILREVSRNELPMLDEFSTSYAPRYSREVAQRF